jgi:hypothetical protein
MPRLLLWRGTELWLAEAASVDFTGSGVTASGTQLGVEPHPYRLDYRLDTGEDFVTRNLRVEASGDGWSRHIELTHDGEGRWDAEGEGVGSGDTGAVQGALDCDLEYSPLTNLMPVRRHSIDKQEIEVDFLVAWVSVPDLGLHASRQRYEHVSRRDDGAVVRYVSLDGEFRANLEVDEDGLVVEYPHLARRVSPGTRA